MRKTASEHPILHLHDRPHPYCLEDLSLNILVLNPGGNSLKVEVVSCQPTQSHAYEAEKLASLAVEGIGKEAKLLHYEGKKVVHTEPIEATDYGQALTNLLPHLYQASHGPGVDLQSIDRVGIRVVHGGPNLIEPVELTADVEKQIVALETLAPLHNKSSVEVLAPARRHFPHAPIYGVFDTAFHRTIPEHASTYAIPLDLAHKHQIRRYGFHGISHRYLLDRYAHLVHRPTSECSLVSMHLESGCSVTAIRNGQSIDNTMGLTPLEGLMMGTRSGDIDPSIIPLLMKEEGMSIDDVMALLNKKSGLQGVSQLSLDTRILMQHYDHDPKAKLAMDIFSYRLLKAVAAHLSAVGRPQAVLFGGGIAENTKLVRQVVADGLRWCGFHLDADANEKLIDIEGRLSTQDSPLQAWVIPVQEGLQIAHEVCQASLVSA
jgi:acetate kinase